MESVKPIWCIEHQRFHFLIFDRLEQRISTSFISTCFFYIYIYTYTLRYTYMYYVYHTFVRSHCFAFNFWMCFFLSLHLNEKFEKKRKKKTSKLLCVVCLCETKRINFCIYIITISHTNKTYSSHETWPSITLLCCPLLSILLLLIYYFSYKIEKKTRFSSKAIRCR